MTKWLLQACAAWNVNRRRRTFASRRLRVSRRSETSPCVPSTGDKPASATQVLCVALNVIQLAGRAGDETIAYYLRVDNTPTCRWKGAETLRRCGVEVTMARAA